ncbi:tetraacyldisaccharide 4'-kinase [Bacteroides sp. 519]|uniref:tetraacyldisaccharide 4'-kinase n=1 Tax=Bacteroides sp. 519 TaxID=2302937 RepID=UPI0013D0C6E0|nr:tetraacyldisaccharide 4'-kinase [Bacteroides sp. 519]NDV58154.1 tetraacyldisaccharide 4'-kinase [Bacteroides sp. 519]
MANHRIQINRWLYPLSWLYGMGVRFRNKLFDWKIFRSESFGIPVINVGNLAVGGTGKTPHIEYLVKILKSNNAVATLSRGYKRKTSGYVVADSTSTARTIGDEPFQIKSKFPEITVVVDEKRVRGIENLMKRKDPAVDVVLLDDAFQHRHVEPGMNILLTDYNRLFCEDTLLPAGRLREPVKGKNRAHIVIVTKCPDTIKPFDFNIAAKCLNLYPYQQLYFSRIKYGELTPVFKEMNVRERTLEQLTRKENILLITGIVSTDDMKKKIRRNNRNIHHLSFADHHNFSHKDIKLITDKYNQLKLLKEEVIIITTEKDAARFVSLKGLSDELKEQMYALPIEIEILQDKQDIFNQNITDYVRKNKRNSLLDKK